MDGCVRILQSHFGALLSHQLNRKVKRVEDDLMRAEELVDELTEYVCVSV